MRISIKYILFVLGAVIYVGNGFCTVIRNDEFGRTYFDGEQIKLSFNVADTKESEDRVKQYIDKTTTEEKHADCKNAYESALKRSVEIQKDFGGANMMCTRGVYDEQTALWAVEIVYEKDQKHTYKYTDKVSYFGIGQIGNMFLNNKKFQDAELLFVSGFVKKGLFKKGGIFVNSNKMFIYTDNTDYATGDVYNPDNILKYVGNYKYETVMGETRSIPAYEETKYKQEDINPTMYKQDKSLRCGYDAKRDVVYWTEDHNYKSHLASEHYAEDGKF